MIYVICTFLMQGSMHKARGVLIEKHGDTWLVAFKVQTIELNGNQCLYTGGYNGSGQNSSSGQK